MDETSDRRPPAVITGRRIAFLGLLLLLAPCIWFGWHFYTHYTFFARMHRVTERIHRLNAERPESITPERWEEAVGWACRTSVPRMP